MKQKSKFPTFVFFFTLVFLFVFLSSQRSKTIHDHSDHHPASPTSKINLNQFEGYRKGHQGLLPIKTYLHRYGYLDSLDHHDRVQKFDDELESAILTYQKNFHLNTTGILDSETLAVMMAPRCGCPDIIKGTNTMASKYSFFGNNLRLGIWEKAVLTVLINKDSFTPEEATWVEQGLVEWNNKTKFEFMVLSNRVTDDVDDDIRMEKLSGDHGDGFPFDGRGGESAHAWGPIDGRVHFDGDEAWTNGRATGNMIDLTSVAVHQLGHVLGLGHSGVDGSVMNPRLGPGQVKREPQKDDLDGIEALYPGFVRR